MSKINQIESELKQIGGAKFQELCNTYLSYLGYNVKDVGGAKGKEKTTKGTPDAYIRMKNGKFIFIEYKTTQKSKLLDELSKDIDACFNSKKAKVPISKIEKIILCFNNVLKPNEVEALSKKCSDQGVDLEFIDLDTLKFEIYKYPQLAKDFLNIAFDTGQILRDSDFVKTYGKHPLTIPIDHQFLYLDSELQQTLTELEKNDLLIIKGKAGVGKTRFALELCRYYKQKYPDDEFFVIYNKEQLDLYQDMEAYFSNPRKNYLILIDDANRVTLLAYILRKFYDTDRQGNFRFVITVRDYAIQNVEKQADGFNYVIKELVPWSDEQIEKWLKQKLEISDQGVFRRISGIAQGNPRLAMMATKLLKAEYLPDDLYDVSHIYERFFGDVVDELSDNTTQKVLGLLAFFGYAHSDHKILMKKVFRVFGIDANDFWEKVVELHRLELVDIYNDYSTQIVKVSDQVLATYFFYKVFIKDELLDYSLILAHFFDGFTSQINDSIIPVFNHYGYENVKQKVDKHLQKKWINIAYDKQSKLKFLEVFWFYMKTETLHFINEEIQGLSDVVDPVYDFSESKEQGHSSFREKNFVYFSILEQFGLHSDEEFRTSLELIFLYLQKAPQLSSLVGNYIRSVLGYRQESYQYDYFIQHTLFDFLIENIRNNENVDLYIEAFFGVVNSFLKTSVMYTSISGKGAGIVTLSLGLNASLQKIRDKIWTFLFELYSCYQAQVLEVLKNHIEGRDPKLQVEIWKHDQETLIPFFENYLDKKNNDHCLLVHSYLDKLELFKIPYPKTKELRGSFTTALIKVEQILRWDEMTTEWREKTEQYLAYKKTQFEQFTKDYQLEDYISFVQAFREVIKKYDKSWEHYQSINVFFDVLLAKNTAWLLKVLHYVFDHNNDIMLSQPGLMQKLVGSNEQLILNFYKLIEGQDYQLKSLWKLHFFENIPKTYINEFYLGELIQNYQNLESNLTLRFAFLERYKLLKYNIFYEVVDILLEKTKIEGFDFSLNLFFWEQEAKYFEQDLTYLKRIYFYQLVSSSGFDYESNGFKRIFTWDEGFVVEYLTTLLKNNRIADKQDGKRFSYLWTLDNYKPLITECLNYAIDKRVDTILEPSGHYFFIDEYGGTLHNDKVYSFIQQYIELNIQNKKRIQAIFKIVTYSYPEKKLEYLSLWLNLNQDLKNFQTLPLLKSSWTGTFSSIEERKIKFWESVLPLLNGLKFLAHRNWVQRKINELKKELRKNLQYEFGENIRSALAQTYTPIITPHLQQLYSIIAKEFPFIDFIAWSTGWFNQWMIHQPQKPYIIIEIEDDEELETVRSVFEFLKEEHPNKGIYLNPSTEMFDLYIGRKDESIILRRLPENAPIRRLKNFNTASLEKMLADILTDKNLFAAQQGREQENIYYNAFDNHYIDQQKLLNYARQLGKHNEVEQIISVTNFD